MPPPHRSLRLRGAASALLVCGLLPAVVPGGTPSAGASSVYLCTGYRACSQAGMSDGGYGARNKTMYWRMYAGHNCTNYVAYRLIQAGMSTERPWSGTGMAYNWGRVMSDITDQVPAVGAVAWWDSGASGVSSSGHVAIVEQVVSSTEIIISEDSWSGDFHWRRITKDGRGWPSGFIHFVDKTVENKVAPQVTGTPQVGTTLRTTRGRWTRATGVAFQWLADLRPIPGATQQTFTPGPEHLGAELTARVTATRDTYTPGVVDTAPTAPVAKGQIVNTTPPVISGDGEVDAVLTATRGSWSATPDETRFRWKSGKNVIEGATASELTLTRSMVGTRISVVEVARRDGFVTAKAFAPQPVGPVVEGVIEVLTPFSSAGRNRHGSELSVLPGTTEPSNVTLTHTWLRNGVAIPGATGATYEPVDADVGRTITARVTISRPRYAPVEQTFSYGTTTSPSTVSLRTVGRQRRAVVQLQVNAPGTTPTGPVTVVVGGKRLEASLVDGRARVVVGELRAGERRVRVIYAGDGVALRSRSAAAVTVLKAVRR